MPRHSPVLLGVTFKTFDTKFYFSLSSIFDIDYPCTWSSVRGKTVFLFLYLPYGFNIIVNSFLLLLILESASYGYSRPLRALPFGNYYLFFFLYFFSCFTTFLVEFIKIIMILIKQVNLCDLNPVTQTSAIK